MTDVEAIVGASRAVLLDFDGPVCDLFAGYPAHVIADRLRAFLLNAKADLPESISETRDPLDLLRWTGARCPELLEVLEKKQVLAECEAANSAIPTPYVQEVMESAVESGRGVVIVSNNSGEAIDRYLKLHGLAYYVSAVVGRRFGAPATMKPEPGPVLDGARHAGVPASACVLVGDSVSDIEAAQRAGAMSIGYAKSTSRRVRLAGADAVVEGMKTISDALVASQR
ncbi:HAD family hydrolase [Actinomadura kijaniata]|uniref:HAD family hydrolase n=1 Tax=Actinomadura kijaniata TaxID=46161 RepID=UPI00082C0752|nr:HAD family hydrolase [Actinomadura kijaniata]